MNLLPIPWMQPVDISNAVAWLASHGSPARMLVGSDG
jgi:hypothetical protein